MQCLKNIKFMCIRHKLGKGSVNPTIIPVFKPPAIYILRHCINIVYVQCVSFMNQTIKMLLTL